MPKDVRNPIEWRSLTKMPRLGSEGRGGIEAEAAHERRDGPGGGSRRDDKDFAFFIGVKRCSETKKIELVGFGDAKLEDEPKEPLKDYAVVTLESRGDNSTCWLCINGMMYCIPC